MVMHLNQCCCFSLRTGSIIIGVLGLLEGISLVLDGAVQEPEHRMPGGTAFVVCLVIVGIIEAIVAVLLIVGAIKNSAKLVYPWIWMSIILLGIVFIVFVIYGIYVTIKYKAIAGLTIIISTLISAVIIGYFILVVNSFHTTIKAAPVVSRA